MIQILDSTYEQTIRRLELQALEMKISDPMEREMFSWNAPWRGESLQHYLNTGWSVGLFGDDGKLKGYFLAQPLLFFKGLTQVLWVEHFSYSNLEDFNELKDTVTRYAREKHLQSVIYFSPQDNQLTEIKTTKR
jgi:hypothetical protein